MDYFEKSEDMIADNVEAIPCRIWDWGIRHYGALRSFPEEIVRTAVLPMAKATVTGKGIKFKGAHYSCDRAIREIWFEKARSKKTWHVTVSYDPRDMASLYIWNQDDKQYDKCYLLDWNQKYAGKCLDEVIFEQKKEAIARKLLKLSETEAKINLNAEIDSIVAEAKTKMEGLPAKSKTERISHIKENRRNEAEVMRSEATSTTGAINNAVKGTTIYQPTSVDEDPILKMIREKVEERLRNE